VKTILHVGKFYPPVPGGMEHVVESLCHVNGGDVVNRALVFNAGPRTVAEVVEGIEVTRIGTIGGSSSSIRIRTTSTRCCACCPENADT